MPSTGDTPLNSTISPTNELSYNNVLFSALYRSEIRGEVVMDDAGRTQKYFKGILSAEGICSAAAGVSLENGFPTLARLLTQQGGLLVYNGRGYGNPVINPPGGAGGGNGAFLDLAWGPIPKLLHFQPLGNGLSAQVRWECEFAIYRTQGGVAARRDLGIAPVNPLQFSYACSISFDEAGYSKIKLSGVLEVALTRTTVGTRSIPFETVDAYRSRWLDIGFDLTKFRITNRNFDESSDRRKMKWVYEVEEIAPMNNPPGANQARGSFTAQPIRAAGRSPAAFGCQWSCTLKATYFLRKNLPRRQAAWLFFQLLQFRMDCSQFGVLPSGQNNNNAPQQPEELNGLEQFALEFSNSILRLPRPGNNNGRGVAAGAGNVVAQAVLSDFKFHEGLYQDSKSMTFEATWMLFTTFRTLLNATGVWHWPASQSAENAASASRQFAGWKSWLQNNFNPQADVIVDFSGGSPPFGQASPV